MRNSKRWGLYFLGVWLLVACDGTTVPEPTVQPEQADGAPSVSLSKAFTSPTSFTVAFQATGDDPDGDALTYLWDFGDGGTAEGANPTHTFQEGGEFSVTVTVSDGTSSASDATTLRLRPADSPDVFILGFAGRCGFAGFGCFNAPNGNEAYLDKEEAQTLQALAEPFTEAGLDARWWSARAHLNGRSRGFFNFRSEPGFADTTTLVGSIEESWIGDFDNPTRLVLVGHSHGAVWASLLAWNSPDVTFDYLVYLDGICSVWWSDHRPFIRAGFDARGLRRPFPLNTDEAGRPCEALDVPGKTSQDIDDVVPDNVGVALEIQASRLSIPSDAEPNHRPDGLKTNIYTLRSRNLHAGSSAVHVKGTQSMTWVGDMLKAGGLLGEQAGLETQAVPDLKELVPAPEGWEYLD